MLTQFDWYERQRSLNGRTRIPRCDMHIQQIAIWIIGIFKVTPINSQKSSSKFRVHIQIRQGHPMDNLASIETPF
jgi:hypothetical protein